jgi:hypothetical protein
LLKRVEVFEVVVPGMERRLVAMPGHADIRQMPVHPRRRQYEDPINRCPLGLMHGGGVAVFDRPVVAKIEADRPALFPVDDDAHRIAADLGDGPKRPVLHPHLAVVAQKHHPVARREGPLATFDGYSAVIAHHLPPRPDRHLAPKLSAAFEDLARTPVEIGFGEQRNRKPA